MVLENVNAVVSNFTEVYYKLDSIIFNTTLAEKDREDQIGRLGETFSREVRALLFIARHYRPEDNYSIFEPEESSSFGGPVQKEIVMENVKAVASNITEVHNKLENILTNTKLNSKEKESQIQRLSEIFPREVRVLYFIARHYRPEDTTPVFEMVNGEEAWKSAFGLAPQKNTESDKFKRYVN
ncbi:Protein CBG26933 [Caenorhabditis briggsae]|uniref:Protein CBG26933 n=1 Tax=Caenorhabditis briggsae TaxID=6238 RepID=B6IH84_CAEBR|nr:Protein CBG26933 [Caenorhabditis briggsae]CAR99264.1 Protein CBG26933 [Caenorhabditis briggsae]